MSKVSFYTVVQHSGYGYGGDATFKRGLETQHVDTAHQRDRVRRAGGLLFDSYIEADEYCMTEMYRTAPPGAFTLVPEAPGTFANAKLGGLAIYVPAPSHEGAQQ